MEHKNRMDKIEESIREIRENHLAHIETDLAKTSSNVEWLMKYHWVVTSASIGGLIAGLINFFKH